jgi:exodeoxyribonuclease V alpha subunit
MTDFYFISCEEPERGVDLIIRLIRDRIPARMDLNPVQDIQVISPMQRGHLGVQNLNRCLQDALNPGEPGIERFGWRYRRHDKVIQSVNNYDKDVFNGDIGVIVELNEESQEALVRFDERQVCYDFGELDELSPAYAISVHKSQGSEYPAVVIPLHVQHYMLLQRNLLYTAVTRGKRLAVIVGSRRALGIAVNRIDSGSARQAVAGF